MEAIGLLTPVVDHTITLVVRQVGYLFNYKSNVQNLETQTKELLHAKERLQHDVNEELRKVGKKTEADVKEWLTKANKIIDDANRFLEDERQAKKCLYGFCRYHPSRQATKLTQIMVELQKRKEFLRLTYSTPLQDTWTTVGYLAFQSRTSIVTQILEEFRKDNINMIGVYGMGGVGKTTLVKEVARKAEEDKLFDNVAMVEVKQNTEVERIQKEIAEKFDLEFDENVTITGRARILRQAEEENFDLGFDEKQSVAGRARILSNYIKDKKILVIFDDVWEELDLEKLGVPVGKCKILLTSRTREVLSSKMGTQKDFMLKVLNEEETWSLFENSVGDDAVKDLDIRKVAIEVANECKGLPILVVTVAKALKGKKLYSWKEVLRNLKGKGMLDSAYSGIEWSYNQLDGEEVKSLFLICGILFKRNYILKYLLRYTMGLGLSLFEGIDTMEEAYDKFYSLVDQLKDFCLLLDTNKEEIVTMHDLTCDAARKIASRDKQFLSFGYDEEFKEWPNKEFLQKCAVISFAGVNIPNLPDALESPRLEMFGLLCKNDQRSLQIPNSFFKEMRKLKVLELSNLSIPSLPASILCLENLHTLCFRWLESRDIAIVGELRSLEILILAYSKVKQLPKEIGQLTRLRVLDLSSCSQLEVIYPNVLSSLTRLEELNMNNNFNKWETEEVINISERSNASLSEVKHLSNLTSLGINIKDANQLPLNFFSKKLSRFVILIGDAWNWNVKKYAYGISCTLKLKLSQTNHWDHGLETILKRCEELFLDVFEGVNNIVYQLDMDGFQRLKKLHVQNNPEISHILNSNIGYTWIHSHAAFPVLEVLSLRNLVSLQSVCSGQLAIETFKKLKIIKVQNCPNLKNLFSFSMLVHEFLELQKIEVVDCKNMKEVVEGKEEQLGDEENDHPIEFYGLRSLTLQNLPKLISFSSNHSPLGASTSGNPMQLFNDKVVFPKLKVLKLSSVPLNKFWDGQLPARLCWIQNLTSLTVEGCDGLTFLCSSSMSINLFVQLKTLEISRCENMVQIILTEEYGEVKNMDNMFPKVESLKLVSLGNLEKFCTSASYIEFPCLRNLIIDGCTKLGPFIVDPIKDTVGHHLFDEKVGFPRLTSLVIIDLHKLTTIWHTQIAPDSFCKLIEFRVESCSSLIHILVPGILKRLHGLKKLHVKYCESVEAVFNVEGTSGGDHDQSEMFIFRNLLEVIIWRCRSLKNVFPTSAARLLEKLELLWISTCEIMEQIIAEEEVGLPPKFMFPSVTILRLVWLPQLRCFYPGKHISMWPSLKQMGIFQCEKVEILADKFSSFQQQHEHETKRPFFLFEKGSFSNLEDLQLGVHVLQYGLIPLEFFKINRLGVHFESDTLSAVLSVLKKFYNLKTLELWNGHMEEIFMHEELLDGEEPHVFAHLKTLKIHFMHNLVHVWKENSHLACPAFPNLEILEVEKCGRLKNIVSSAISFRNLVQLKVLKCHGLNHLITCSVAKCLVQLQSLIVENCQRMVEIVASSDDNENVDAADANEITFSQLKDLKLSDLPNLKGFCSKNYNVKFPFLTNLSVTSCLEMKISIDGVLQNDSKHEGVPLVTEEEEQGEEDDNDDVDDFEKCW